MRKNIIRLLITMLLFMMMSIEVFAAREKKDLFELEKSYNMAVSILFDKELPSVSFIAPDGKVIEASSLKSDKGKDWIQFYLPNAAVGQWKISYDKKSNTRFEINYSSYMDGISIDKFNFGKVKEGLIPVHFKVTGASEGKYQWKLYAVVMEKETVAGERMLNEGESTFGDKVHLDVDIQELSDYEGYRLRLDVWQREGVEETSDSQIADGTFAVRGNNFDAAIDDFRADLNLTEGQILIDWSEWAQSEEYIVAVFDMDKKDVEPIYFTEVIDGSNQAKALFDSNVSAIRIDVTGRNGKKNTKTKSKTIKIKNGVVIKSGIGELTNSSQANIEYEVPRDIIAEVVVNGKSDKVNLSGSGNFSLNLTEVFNEAEIRYSLEDPNVVYVVKFQTTVDNVPPILRLPENKTAVNIGKDSYVLVGVTEAGSELKINDEVIPVNPDGSFLHTLSLENGENIFKVTAADKAGNVAAQDVILNRLSDKGLQTVGNDKYQFGTVQKYFPLIFSFVFSIVFLLMLLFISRRYGKTENKRLFVLRTLRNLSIGFGIIGVVLLGYFLSRYVALSRLSKGEEYFALAMESIDDAYKVLQEKESFLHLIKLFTAMVLGIAAVSVLLGLIIKKFKKERNVPLKITDLKSAKEGQMVVFDKSRLLNEAQTGEFICPNCGMKYDQPIKFCEKCGRSM